MNGMNIDRLVDARPQLQDIVGVYNPTKGNLWDLKGRTLIGFKNKGDIYTTIRAFTAFSSSRNTLLVTKDECKLIGRFVVTKVK